MTRDDVYRDVSLSAAEARELRELAERLDVLGDATDDCRWHGWAGMLRLVARRFERQEPIEVGPGVFVDPAETFRALRPTDDVVVALRPRPRLQVIEGGAA